MLLHHTTYADKTPDTPAYIMANSGKTITWHQLSQRVNQCGQYFKGIGLKTKDHIALLMENNDRYLEITLAAIDAGLIFTPISTHLRTAETEYIINNSGAKLLITSQAKTDLAKELLTRMPGVDHRLMVGEAIDGYESYESTINAYPATPISYGISGRPMLYSSGTTGQPKGVLSQIEDMDIGYLTPTADIAIKLYNVDHNTIYLSPAPLYHAAPLGFCLMSLAMGGTCIIMEKFDAEMALSLIQKYQATHSQWVPTMFIRMLKLPLNIRCRYDISSMKVAIHAAAPTPIPIKEQMIEWWGPVFYEYYAGTEGNTMTLITSQDWLVHKGSVGRPFIGTMHILDDLGHELPPGQFGHIYVADGHPFEYYKEPEKTAESRNSKGWSTMGDIGYLDEAGYLYLTDRKSNMIISGGVNIYPQEAENLLTLHPMVSDVAVFGIPNEEFGEEVKAVVQLVSEADAGPELEQELIIYCKERLSNIKCPRSIDFKENLPRTPTGKLIKRLLKETYWKE